MDNKDIFLDYVLELYKEYKNRNYESLLDFCNGYKIRFNEYKKDIKKTSNQILETIKNKLITSNTKYSFKETKKSIKINIIYSSKNYPSTSARIVMPVFVDNSLRVCNIIIDYIIKNKINSNIKISNINVNNLVTITFLDYEQAKIFMNYYYSDENLKKDIKNEIIPLIPQFYGLGIYTEIYPYNYIDRILHYLFIYFKKIKDKEEISYEGILEFLEKNKRNCNNKIIEREMISIIIESIKIMRARSNPIKLFDYNAEMNIGSFNPSDYNLLLDENKLLYFENKERTLQILFGNDEYMNICYSKFYKNVIEKSPSNLYYSYFKNIYFNILHNKFENMYSLLDFSSLNKDLIYQELMIISSGFFAYKKLNFSFDDANMIIKKVLEKKLNCSIDYQERDINKYTEREFVFPFNIEYGNKVLYLHDNKITTVYNYFRENKVLDYIPLNSIVNLKDGSIINATEYLKNIYLEIPNYDSFQELIKSNIEFIEINN